MKKFSTIFLFIFCCFVNSSSMELSLKGLCAHRRASSTHPENTRASILEAVKLGAQMIEFDVRLTKDNQLVLMHNETINRTTNGSGAVNDFTLPELKTFDAGSWKSDLFKGEKIPSLEEILDIIPDTVWMNIHVKDNTTTAVAVAELLTRRNKVNNAVLAVDNKSALAVRKYNGSIKICCMERGNSTGEYFRNSIMIKADFIQLTEREFPIIEQAVEYLKKYNLTINYYYADTPDKMKKLFEAGVDFVLVNKLPDLKKHLKELLNFEFVK